MSYPTYPSVSVPNVPTARLEDYLDFWESERGAVRALREGRVAGHAEWDINVPVPAPYYFGWQGKDSTTFAGYTELRNLGTEPDGSATIGECGTLSEWARGNGVAPTAAGAVDTRIWCYTSGTPEVRGTRVAYLFTVRGGTETRTITTDAILRSPQRAPAASSSAGLFLGLLALVGVGAWAMRR